MPEHGTAAPDTRAQTPEDRHSADLLPKDQWYLHYLNPLQLLGCPADVDLHDLGPRALKGLKDRLLKEIELEDGAVAWLPGVRFDASRAIGACGELQGDIERRFHWYVFRSPALLDFLTRGAFPPGPRGEAALCAASCGPPGFPLGEEESAAFRTWLSEPFARQFDLVLTKAIERRDGALTARLLAQSRTAAAAFANAGFKSTRRQVGRLLEPLREAGESSKQTRPSPAGLDALLQENFLIDLLNGLPVDFLDYRDEAAAIIRAIAHAAFTKHADIDLAKAILEMSGRLENVSPGLRAHIEDDFADIGEIIARKSASEARLTAGDTPWEITRHGALKGAQHIPAGEATALRAGTLINRVPGGAATYDFLIAVTGQGTEIRYAWQVSQDGAEEGEIERNMQYFCALLDAAFAYILPVIVRRIAALLEAGGAVDIGPCSATRAGVSITTAGWFSARRRTVPWERLGVDLAEGDLVVFDSASPAVRARLDLRTTDNAVVLRALTEHTPLDQNVTKA